MAMLAPPSMVIAANKDDSKKRTVKALDIVTLFKELGISEEDFVVVKMDVEGAEFDLVTRILTEGLHKQIDMMGVEWHHENPCVLQHMVEKYRTIYESLQYMLMATNIQMMDWSRRL